MPPDTIEAIRSAETIEIRATWQGLNDNDYGYLIIDGGKQPPQPLHISNFMFRTPELAIQTATAVVEEIRPKAA